MESTQCSYRRINPSLLADIHALIGEAAFAAGVDLDNYARTYQAASVYNTVANLPHSTEYEIFASAERIVVRAWRSCARPIPSPWRFKTPILNVATSWSWR